ncbi:MAG: thiamine pyrophosphate-binding protein, partial [Deltaproteobacteria bacterium]|nr:thiamine pyrophosphate-binding protein [Deltaproteobacteria bacterium]
MKGTNGGKLIADVLRKQGVEFVFTLCGGHISPILVESQRAGIRVVDMRDEKNAVFAADAMARMTGVPGVAAVTAGPGVTNTLTAIQNAYMAQSPLILLGGATATALRGRGALQDIDQISPIQSMVKMTRQVKRVKD